MKKWKNLKNYSFFILIAVSTILFTAIGYFGKSNVYADYAVKLLKTPQLAVVFQGLSEGTYPWTKAESDEAIETIAHDWEDLNLASNDPSDNDKIPNDDVNNDTSSNDKNETIIDDSSSDGNAGNGSSGSQSTDNNNSTSNNANQEPSQSDVIDVDTKNQDSNNVSPTTQAAGDEDSDINSNQNDNSTGDDIDKDDNTTDNEQTDLNNNDNNIDSNIDNDTDSTNGNTTNTTTDQDNDAIANNDDSNDYTPKPNSDIGSTGKVNTNTTNISSSKGSKTNRIIFEEVKKSYFNDALFIGDSRTVGLCEYSYLSNATYFSDVGLNIYAVFDKKIAKIGGRKYTIDAALTKKQFKKIYIMLGINELGTGTTKSFTTEYHKVITKIQKLQPNAIIVIQGIMNVGKAKSDKDPIFNNKRIKERNKSLSKLADNKKIFYLDVNEVITDKNGYLPLKYSFDGIHLKAKYYNIWADFLKTHGIVLDDM